jgi:AcrR family transcriptional regulator
MSNAPVAPSDPAVLVPRRRGSPSTRRRIADAALELFSTQGYARTTLQQIADAAGVHVQTIYLTFGTKTLVLAAACEALRADGEDPELPPTEWSWAKELLADPDPASQLRRYAAHIRRTAPRGGPLVAAVRSAAHGDPDVTAFLAHAQAGRYLGPSGIVALLAEKGALRDGLDRERAADTMFAVSSYESYELLVTDRGWSPDDYERWLGEVLCELLLEPAPSRRVRSAGSLRRPPRGS